MNFKMQRGANLLIGILLIVVGLYFTYSCTINIHRMEWNIINSEFQTRVLQNPTGEDFNQLILSAICGLGAIICGASHLWYLVKNIDKKQ